MRPRPALGHRRLIPNPRRLVTFMRRKIQFAGKTLATAAQVAAQTKNKMKTRQFVIILATALVLAGLWFGRLAWRAHRNLVTLHARNMPLADVVRSLEHQTCEHIRFDKRLRAKIT